MTARPAIVACFVLLALLPVLVWLGVGSPASVATTMFVTGAVVGGVFYRRGVRIREALRDLPKGGLSRASELENQRDLLGVADAFASMRRELDRLMTRLEAADAQRRRLFADLAHELATPASALLGLGDTLGDVPLDDAKRTDLLQQIEAETLRIARLVEDIRDLAELDDPDVTFERGPTMLVDVVRRAVAARAPKAVVSVEGAPEVDADAHRLEQAFGNVLANAKRYSPDVQVHVRAADGHATVTVDDTGPGVPPDKLGQLGERLFRVDASRERRKGGHGLGLSIVRAVLRRHDGDVRFEPSPAGGLRVVLTMPLKSEIRS